jgi:hypothetical protein
MARLSKHWVKERLVFHLQLLIALWLQIANKAPAQSAMSFNGAL